MDVDDVFEISSNYFKIHLPSCDPLVIETKISVNRESPKVRNMVKFIKKHLQRETEQTKRSIEELFN